MEYSVGSLADLISGTNTPNKRKVVKQEFKIETKPVQPIRNVSTSPRKQTTIDKKYFEETSSMFNNLNVKTKKKKQKSVSFSNDSNKLAVGKNKKKKLAAALFEDKLSKKLKKEQKEELVVADDTVYNDTAPEKKNKKKRKMKEEPETEFDDTTTSQEKLKKKKRKADTDVSTESTDDGQETLQTDQDETSETAKKKMKKEPTYADNAKRRVGAKEPVETPKMPLDPEREQRTVFVGNIPVAIKKTKLKRMFKRYGTVEAVRIRSIAIADPKVPKKVAICKKELHPDRKSVNGYVRFATRDEAIKALQHNGFLFDEHHIRVKLIIDDVKTDQKKAIFLGNVPFGAEDEDIWKLFAPCGEIESVRLVRDQKTNIGKGFGYVNFKSNDSVELALQMDEVKLEKRVLRIKRADQGFGTKKRDSMGKKIRKHRPNRPDVKPNVVANVVPAAETKAAPEFKSKTSSYQGAQFVEKKKKKKLDKGLLKKKKIIKLLKPRT